MAVSKGCQEGKATPELREVKCPKCGANMEVFVYLTDGVAGKTHDESKCDVCGYIVPEGTPVADLK